MIEASKMVVVNKFSNLESKIAALAEMVKNIEIEDDSLLPEKQKQFYYSLKQTILRF